jgi:pyruvate,water dikinase
VLAAARGAAPPGSLRGPIATAKAERAWVALHPLPAFYGPPPAPMPDLRWLPRAARMVNEALQLDAPTSNHARQPAPEALLTGVPGSSGRHTGPVRIVRTPGDFASLRRGEVLVCSVTDPAWSVLFGVAGAVVTDGGGVLTHSAIIAREHGIPAVLGTGTATKELTDGQLITVDGGRGLVLPADRGTREAP